MCRIVASCALLWCVALTTSVSSSEEPQALPDEIRGELDWLSGTWQMKGRVGDVKLSGVWSARWADGEHCLTRHSKSKRAGKNGERIGISVIGWDAANKCIIEHAFFSNGDSLLLRWNDPSPNKWVGEVTGVEDGQQYTARATATKQNKDRFIYESETSTGDEVEILLTRTKTDKTTKTK
jgi:hypothetical protein